MKDRKQARHGRHSNPKAVLGGFFLIALAAAGFLIARPVSTGSSRVVSRSEPVPVGESTWSAREAPLSMAVNTRAPFCRTDQ